MISTPPAFLRYVEAARHGRIELWRILVGALYIVTVYGAAIVTLFYALDHTANGWIYDSPAAVAYTLATSLAIWCAVWLALRVLHRRRLRSVLGAEGRISWRQLGQGLAAAFIVSIGGELAGYTLDPSIQRSSLALNQWALWLAPVALFIGIQASADELLFRGYLMQSLAARFRNPFIWAVAPLVAFILLYWDSAASESEWMSAAALFSTGAFGLTATILVCVTGNLGASIGLNLGYGLFGIVLFSHYGWYSQMALFVGRPMEGLGWTAGDAFFVGLSGIAGSALSLWLLLDRRSPLAVKRESSGAGQQG